MNLHVAPHGLALGVMNRGDGDRPPLRQPRAAVLHVSSAGLRWSGGENSYYSFGFCKTYGRRETSMNKWGRGLRRPSQCTGPPVRDLTPDARPRPLSFRAKRSQFARGCQGMGADRQGCERAWGQLCKTKPIPPSRQTGLCEDKSYETKPICLAWTEKTIPKALGLEIATRQRR